MIDIRSIFPSRFTVIVTVICLLAVPAAVFSSYGWGLAHRDFVRVDEELNTPVTGVRDQLKACQIDKSLADGQLKSQSDQIKALADEGEKARARTEQLVAEANARTEAAERRVHRLLAEQKRDGETACDAAYRLIMETVQ